MRANAITRIARRRPGELVMVGLGLLALFCLYLGPAAFGGRALLPADALFEDPIWQAQAPAGFRAPANPLLTDQIYQFYPWRLFSLEQLRRGQLPLWNPYVFSGSPFIANDQSAVFYPINLLLTWLPAHLIPGWSAILRLLTASLGMYALLRAWKASPAASVLAGITFALGGFVMLLLGHPHTNVIIWLPLLILTADKTLSAPNPWPWALLGAATIGAQFLGGHAETSFFTLLVWGLYALVQGSQHVRHNIPRLGFLCLSLIAGAALAAIQLLPFLELLPQSNYYLSRASSAQGQPWLYTHFWQDSLRLLTAFLPNLFGNPTTGNWWIGTTFLNYTGVLYMGILPLALAGAGTWLRRREWQVVFLGLLGLFSLIVISRWPVFDLVRQLPLFNVAATSGGFQAIYCFCLPALAGLGLDGVLHLRPASRALRRLSLALAIFAGIAALGLGTGYLILRLFRDQILVIGKAYIETHVYGKPPHPYPLDFYLNQLDDRYHQLLSVFDPARLILYLPLIFAALSALVLWALYRDWLRPARAGILCVALVLADVLTFSAGFNPTVPAAEVFPTTPALAWLAQHAGYERVTEIGRLLPANTGMPFGLFDVRGYDVGIGRYAALLHSLNATTEGYVLSEHNGHILDLAGVRYLLAAQSLPVSEDLTLVYDGEIKIYERAHPLPRAYLTASYQVIPDTSALLAALDQPDVVSGRQVLLEEPPSIVLPAGQPASSTARIQSYAPDSVTLSVDTAQPAMLVLSDAAYPGWHALVDGQEAKLYRANFAFRAVPVPAGLHAVSFVYQPISVRLGIGLSLGTLGLLTLLGGVVWWKELHGTEYSRRLL